MLDEELIDRTVAHAVCPFQYTIYIQGTFLYFFSTIRGGILLYLCSCEVYDLVSQ
jgi:hypothetical protein